MARSPRSSNGKSSKQVDALKHDEATRRNIPTAEMESFFRRDEDAAPRPPKHYPRARPLAEGETRTPEEPSQPDLKRRTAAKREAEADIPDLFADFNGITPEQRAEFYQHDQHWSNRMILGDSLQVMASLSERESLKGKVQCIYFDPPYGIRAFSDHCRSYPQDAK
jgi:hypothetical protein